VPAEQDDQSARDEDSDPGGCLIAEWSAVVGGRSGSCRGCRRSGDPHAQKFGGTVEPQHDPDDEQHETPARIDEQLRLDEANVPSARAEGAAAGRHDVLHPLDGGTIGKREDLPVAASEGVDRRAVCPTALPSRVLQDPETRQPAREPPRDWVEDVRREWSDGSHPGRWHGHRRLVIEASFASFGGVTAVAHRGMYLYRPPGGRVAFAATSIAAPPRARSTMLIGFRSCPPLQ
jgi:hypothetical protein